MIMTLKRLLLIVASVSLLSSCGNVVAEAEYPGIYMLKRGDAKEVIDVVAGGTYKHRLERQGVLIFDEFGYWDKDNFGEAGITFKSFQVALGAELKPKGYWFVIPEKSWTGKVMLCVDDDGTCFEKM